ncbi:hypothetical protein KC19_VG177800 [Ceratodon purpureus]|uniref:Piwi domain-containing protein n=1 Tax=Ceratodon purpureus TaxID=3225 RepID=A0A8T0HSA3_CERPU|nr:hypothetical protein KC19_VG177800 [Ceratodon purpureus]
MFFQGVPDRILQNIPKSTYAQTQPDYCLHVILACHLSVCFLSLLSFKFIYGPISVISTELNCNFRDGVSKSQFQECLEFEFTALKRACEDLEEGYNPGITFIVAQKRHSTRFFPQGNDKTQKGNCVPGTVVDKDACHPHNYDFFLISQNGFIGTSRPTHYHVLVTENKHLKPDDIQSVTNNLCYTFGRCTSAISMAAPAADAHNVPTRYRKLVDT